MFKQNPARYRLIRVNQRVILAFMLKDWLRLRISRGAGRSIFHGKGKKKVKFTLEQAMRPRGGVEV